jgi:hypothetical protein
MMLSAYVFHDPKNQDAFIIADGVNFTFLACQVLVDQDRVVFNVELGSDVVDKALEVAIVCRKDGLPPLARSSWR